MATNIGDIAKELKVTPREVLSKAKSLGIDATTSASNVEKADADALREAMAKNTKTTSAGPKRVARKKTDATEDESKPRPARVAAKRVKKEEVVEKEETDVSNDAPAVGDEKVKATKEETAPAKKEPVKEEKKTKAKKEDSVQKIKVVERKSEEKEEPKKDSKKEIEAKAETKTTTKKTTAKNEAEEKEEKKSTKAKKDEKEEKPSNHQRIKIVKSAEEIKKETKAKKEQAAEKAKEEKEKKEKSKEERPTRGKVKTHVKVAENVDVGGKHGRKAGKKTHREDGEFSEERESKHGKGKKRKDRNKYDKFGKDREPISLEKKVKKKHVKQKPEPEPEIEEEPLPVGTKIVDVPITIAGFSEQVGVSIPKIIMTLLGMGIVANQNQNMDEVVVTTLADELGIQVQVGHVEEESIEEGIENFEDREKDLVPRPPIITVMGHVDHGKTSLLDAIRETNITEKESGGITQHIGASEVEINGHKIVFLDTPGHEAFTAMRARGANITDIAILVVAADDSVKPQTIESINHAKAAKVPIIVAINKMDKPGANPDKVKADLAEHGILVEDWGGDVICVPVSAKSREGIVNLLEMIILQSEVLELKANPKRHAMGTVIEARLDKAKGPVATLLVTNGTLKTGQSIVAGTSYGRIRLMTNYKGDTIRKALPATAVEVLGLSEVPAAGDEFNAVSEDKVAREIAENRKDKQRDEIMARTSGSTLEELFSSIQAGEAKELNLIVKADVRGSVGAIIGSLEKLSTDEVKVRVIHEGVGAINESDVTLAGTSGAVIIGFNVRPTAVVSNMADRENVQIRTYRVIYDIIDDVENAMKGMLDPEFKEEVLGEVEVRETFKVPGVGLIAGAYVTNGKIVRNAAVRLVREGIVIHEGSISSLKRFKDDAKEVAAGFECGIGIENYNDIKVGDYIECYHMVEVARED